MASKSEYPQTRRYQRARIRCNVTFRGESCWQTCRAENISEGGIFIRAIPADCVGTEVDLEIEIPNKELSVMAKGEVVWSESDRDKELTGCGVKFLHLYRMDREFIQQYITLTQKE